VEIRDHEEDIPMTIIVCFRERDSTLF
jgi:hypothetical protein